MTETLRSALRDPLVAIAIGATLVSLLAAFGLSLTRRWTSAALRQSAWRLVMGVLLLLLAAPWVSSAVPAATPAVPASASPASAWSAPAVVDRAAPVGPWMAYGWGAGVVAMLLWSAFGWRAAHRMATRATPIEEPDWQARIDASLAALPRSVPQRLRVKTTVERVPPMIVGMRTPTIVLPASAAQWDEATLRSVLLHEAAHLLRRDAWWQWISTAVGALYWWHPVVHYARRRFRLEQELACDDVVLSCGVPAPLYARQLLTLATVLRPPSPALAVAAGSTLTERIPAMLDRTRRRRPLGGVGHIVLGSMAVLLLASGARVMRALPTLIPAPPPPSRWP